MHRMAFWVFLLIPFLFSACQTGTSAPSAVSVSINTLALSSGTLVPEFSADVTNYTVTVPNSQTTLTFTIGLPSTTLSVTANGTAVTDGEFILPLEVGENNLELIVTNGAQTTKTYNLVITRQSTDALLSALTLSSGTLTPTFDSNTFAYTATVSNAISSLTVTPTTRESHATLQASINDGSLTAVTSGSASGDLTLNVGANTITLRVTAQDGSTAQDYTVTVTRQPSSDATLSALSLSAGTLAPVFSSGTTAYTATVLNATTSLTITPTTTSSSATVIAKVNAGSFASVTSGAASGNLALSIGSNTVTIRVTAQDGTTTQDTVITVTRPSADASLSDLDVIFSGTDLILDPVFATGTLLYEAFMPTGNSLTVKPTVNQADATVAARINSGSYAAVTSGVASGALTTSLGENNIDVKVTAQDGTIQTYTTVVYNQYAYVVNGSNNNVSYCALDDDHLLINCQTTGSGFNTPAGIAFAPGRTHVYITSVNNNQILLCTPQSDGSFANCASTGSNFNGPSDIVISPDGNHAYASNFNDSLVIHCDVNANGTLSNCANTGSGFGQPQGITLNEAGTILYTANWNAGDITTCAVNSNGSLNSCQITAGGAGFSLPSNVTMAPSGDLAYIADYSNNDVVLCDVNVNGSLSNCAQAASGFDGPIDVAIDPFGLYAYVTSYNDDSVTICEINSSTGALSNCASTGSGFNGPTGVLLQ